MITDLKPYAEFKESGLPWLGQVPRHWGRPGDCRRGTFAALGFDLELTIRFGISSDRGFRLGGAVATICG